MTEFSINRGAVHAVVADLNRITNRIRGKLAELEADSARTLSAWTSEAKLEYQQCKARWDAAASNMPQLLAQAASKLPQIDANYGRGDQAGCDLWASTGTGRR